MAKCYNGNMTTRTRALLPHSPWDALPVAEALLHLAFIVGLFLAFPVLPAWGVILLGLIYAYSIAWSVNSISHNFIHNPYFSLPVLNRAFSVLLSVTLAFSQTMYHYVHNRHHSGNMDRPDPSGETVDPISIYRHGKDGLAENVWRYSLLSYFRDDPPAIYRAIKARRPRDARWALAELAALAIFYGTLAILNWKFILCFLPFYYLGHMLSAVNGYYEHLAGDPDLPLAWGVSSYNRLYNLTWMNNGYHAEHHYRPKQHWTRMEELRRELKTQQQAAGMVELRWPHVFGFMEPKATGRRRA